MPGPGLLALSCLGLLLRPGRQANSRGTKRLLARLIPRTARPGRQDSPLGGCDPMLHPVAWMRGPMVADAITDEERGRDDNYAGFQIDAVRGRA